MEPLTQRVRGKLYVKQNKTALLIDQEAAVFYLRYALVVRGPEYPIFPALIMDDWGQQRETLDIFEWVVTEGHRFPRSDVFGYEQDGTETQYFLRELEVHYKFPVYVYPTPESPIPAGILLHQILLPNPDHTGKPQHIPRPEHIPWPLRHANLTWWQINPQTISDSGFTNQLL